MHIKEIDVKPHQLWLYESEALDLWKTHTLVFTSVVPNVLANGERIPPWIVARMQPGEETVYAAFDREREINNGVLPHFDTERQACEWIAAREGITSPYTLEQLDWPAPLFID